MTTSKNSVLTQEQRDAIAKANAEAATSKRGKAYVRSFKLAVPAERLELLPMQPQRLQFLKAVAIVCKKHKTEWATAKQVIEVLMDPKGGSWLRMPQRINHDVDGIGTPVHVKAVTGVISFYDQAQFREVRVNDKDIPLFESR